MQHIVEVAFDYNDKAITEYIKNQRVRWSLD